MKLENKKSLIARALNVGKERVILNTSRLSEIKEAITRQDIKELKDAGAIIVKEKSGRKKITKRTTRRKAGSIKKKKKSGKREYMIITRKLRAYLKKLKTSKKISPEDFTSIRKEIRSRNFKSLNHMKESIGGNK